MHLPSFAKLRKAVRVYYCKEPCQLPKSDQREAHDFLSFCKNTESGACKRTD